MIEISRYGLLMFLLSCFVQALDKVEITIDDEYISYLDSHPYDDTSFIGTFTSNDTLVFQKASFSYRGAYSLNNLIKSKAIQRNWKFKVPNDMSYRNYKVWNYNYEPFITHNLAYLLMKDAGVPCIQMREVVMYVNGILHGLYSEYPDPDNKKWIKETFGNPANGLIGDLFKAATDKPNLKVKYLADLTVLGINDSDYYLHYNKKTNDSTEAALQDYSSLIKFIKIINETPDAQFADTISKYFDIMSFLKYLVVANYSNFWDGYPNRAKNYWLYLNPITQKWVFIPWDLDQTFNPKRAFFNNMGPECSYLYMYGLSDLNKYYTNVYQSSNNGKSEISPRPLFTRIMNVEKFQKLYASEYKRALSTYLNKELLINKVDSIARLAFDRRLTTEDSLEVDTSVTDTKQFIELRSRSLEEQLRSVQIERIISKPLVNRFPIMFRQQNSSLLIVNNSQSVVFCKLYQANGKLIYDKSLKPHGSDAFTALPKGLVIYTIKEVPRSVPQNGYIQNAYIYRDN
jgi:hypothetical protein